MMTVSGYIQACKNSACSAYDNVSIGQCKSFLNGVWAEWFCIDCAGKKHRMRGLGKDAYEIPEEIEAPAE